MVNNATCPFVLMIFPQIIIIQMEESKLVNSIEEELPDCVKHYRHIHQYPEIGLEQHHTAAYIRDIISSVEGAHIDPPLPQLPTAIIARVHAAQINAPTILLRCELDALALKEQSGLPHASTNELHHACGHDGHMASLIAALRHAAKNRNQLKRNVVFCFQPGEEGKGGANKLFKLRPDLLQNIQECYAIHFYNGMYPGMIALGKGPVTAHSSRFFIEIEGKSTHCMAPQGGIDANFIGCQLVGQLYSLIGLKVPPLNGSTLVVYKIIGGGEATRVSNKFELAATMKVTTTLDFQKLEKTITDITNNLCSAYGAKANIRFITDLYRPVINDGPLVQQVRKKLEASIKGLRIEQNQKSFAGEDFCQFSERKPSVLIAVGSGVPNSIDPVTKESKHPLHSPFHKLDEAVFATSTKVWSTLMFT